VDEPQHTSVEKLFRQHGTFVKLFLCRLHVPTQVLDDAVQEVFLVAYKLGGYREGRASPRTWLGEIAVRIAANTRRKFWRKNGAHDSAMPLDLLPATHDMSPDVLFTQRRVEARVQRTLGTLTTPHREVFVRFYCEGDSCTDIATELGIPTGTVYSRLHMARVRFTEAWESPVSA